MLPLVFENGVSSTPINGYKHIFALNGYNLPTKGTINRYMPESYLIKDINDKVITFSSPYYWDDPFESRYLGLDYKNKLNYDVPSINCLCFTAKHSANEDAMWRRYAKVGGQMLNVEYDTLLLFDQLENSASSYGFRVFVCEAIYVDKNDLLALTPSNHKYGHFFSSFSLEKYLTLLCLKRGAYSYENEIRMFLVHDKQQTNLLYSAKIQYPCGLIGRITISPYPIVYNPFPFPEGQGRLVFKKKLLISKYPFIKNICVSNLFASCPKCKL